MLLPDLSKVHTTSGAKAGKISARRHLHPGYLDASEVVVADGVAVTSPARTAADVACGASDFAQALAVMDSALRNGVTPMTSLRSSTALGQAWGSPGAHWPSPMRAPRIPANRGAGPR